MKPFTRFEHQYILMLAGRAKSEIEKDIESHKGFNDQFSEQHIQTLERYAEALKSIAEKSGHNMKVLKDEQ